MNSFFTKIYSNIQINSSFTNFHSNIHLIFQLTAHSNTFIPTLKHFQRTEGEGERERPRRSTARRRWQLGGSRNLGRDKASSRWCQGVSIEALGLGGDATSAGSRAGRSLYRAMACVDGGATGGGEWQRCGDTDDVVKERLSGEEAAPVGVVRGLQIWAAQWEHAHSRG
jgi:hypothetical protein